MAIEFLDLSVKRSEFHSYVKVYQGHTWDDAGSGGFIPVEIYPTSRPRFIMVFVGKPSPNGRKIQISEIW